MSNDARTLLENIAYDIMINDRDFYGSQHDIKQAIKAATNEELFSIVENA